MDARWPGNLPAEVTNFVGRQREIEQLHQVFAAGRLTTLTGPGGVGKSRLAKRFAVAMQHSFPDGVWLVELGELRASDLLPFQVARAIGITNSSCDPLPVLAEKLAAKRLMLVVDNCEHMVSAVVELVSTLLTAAPDLRILTTSRQVLGAEGERIFEVPALPLDLTGADAASRQSDAAQLFLDRATAVVPNLVVQQATMDTIAALCQRLEGMPLAIELAAARLRAYSVHEILERLEQSFAVLASGPRSAPPRHRALNATIEWSFGLCSPAEKLLWARLSVFAGGFDIEAAENVCADQQLLRPEIFGLLAALVDKSVLSSRTCADGRGTRFKMLETVREFGQLRLAESNDANTIGHRHIEHFAALAGRYHVDYFSEREVDWFRAVVADLPNLRVALQNCLAEPAYFKSAFQIASCLRMYWASPGFISEGIEWLRRALATDPEPSLNRAEALWTLSFLELVMGDVDRGLQTAAECQELAETLPSERIRAFLTLCPVLADFLVGDLEGALAHARDAARCGREVGDAVLTGEALSQGFMMAFVLDHPETEDLGTEALEFLEAKRSQMYRALVLMFHGLLHCRRGDAAAALPYLSDAYEVFDLLGHGLSLAMCMGGFAWVAAVSGEPERSARFLGAAHTIWQAGPLRHPSLLFQQHIAAQVEKLTENAIDASAFTAAFNEGAHRDFHLLMGQTQLAIARGSDEHAVRQPTAAFAMLTRREIAIAELVAKGLTNSEIADELVVSRRTVESHVYHVFAKLGLQSRREVAEWFTSNADSAGDAHPKIS